MKKTISWDQITKLYSGQWVELVDCEWEWHEAHPKQARVQNASFQRSNLFSTNKTNLSKEESIILFVSSSKLLPTQWSSEQSTTSIL